MTENDVRKMLKQACEKAGSQRAFARQHGLSAAYITDVLLARRAPAKAICKALGLQMTVRYLIEFRKYKKA